MKNKYTEFDLEANETLTDIFVVLEEKFIRHAVSNDVLVVRPDLQQNKVIACLAKAQNYPGSLDNNVALEKDLEPYFQLIKNNFTCEVVYEFIVYQNAQTMYIKSLPGLMSQKLIEKVKDPEYKTKNKNRI